MGQTLTDAASTVPPRPLPSTIETALNPGTGIRSAMRRKRTLAFPQALALRSPSKKMSMGGATGCR